MPAQPASRWSRSSPWPARRRPRAAAVVEPERGLDAVDRRRQRSRSPSASGRTRSSPRITSSTRAGRPSRRARRRPSSDDPLTLEVPLQPLVGGVYTVAWRTVSAVDGHRAAGSFAFGLGITPAPSRRFPGAERSGRPRRDRRPAAIASRWLLYLGLLALLGAELLRRRRRAPVTAARTSPAGRRLGRGRRRNGRRDRGSGHRGRRRSRAGARTSFGPQIVERAVPLLIAGLALIVGARTAARSAWS